MTLPTSRRSFLKTGGLALVGLTVVGCESSLVEPIATGERVPFLTPTERFYIRNGAEIEGGWTQPEITREQFEMTIDGAVTTPQTVRFDGLAALEAMTLAEVAGDVLILSDDAGREMVFRRE